jgi:hypothetical protein
VILLDSDEEEEQPCSRRTEAAAAGDDDGDGDDDDDDDIDVDCDEGDQPEVKKPKATKGRPASKNDHVVGLAKKLSAQLQLKSPNCRDIQHFR